jgi:hypothetical protein
MLTAPGSLRAGTNRIARASQRSAHERHTTRFRARQFAAIVAFSAQGSPAVRSSARGTQASAQRPQKVQAPFVKSTSGNPPEPRTTMCSGQASLQALQRVQRERNSPSESAQGMAGRPPRARRPVRNPLLVKPLIVLVARYGGEYIAPGRPGT